MRDTLKRWATVGLGCSWLLTGCGGTTDTGQVVGSDAGQDRFAGDVFLDLDEHFLDLAGAILMRQDGGVAGAFRVRSGRQFGDDVLHDLLDGVGLMEAAGHHLMVTAVRSDHGDDGPNGPLSRAVVAADAARHIAFASLNASISSAVAPRISRSTASVCSPSVGG